MRREYALALFAGTLLLVACSGGGDEALDAEAGPRKGTPSSAASTSQIVVRYDHDGDSHVDTVTLETTRSPLVIVEAIRGTADGGGTNATNEWRGAPVERALNDALQLHLAESFSVASPLDLDVVLEGRAVTITVIE
jgi:hypothetical protein